MKKILPLILIGVCNQHLSASEKETVSEFYNKASLALAYHKKHGAQINDINGLRPHTELLIELHDIDGKDNSSALLQDARTKQFIRHLSHHFGKLALREFITIVESHAPETIVVVEEHFEQATINFFSSRHNPKVKPEGKTLIGYLTKLRDQNDE